MSLKEVAQKVAVVATAAAANSSASSCSTPAGVVATLPPPPKWKPQDEVLVQEAVKRLDIVDIDAEKAKRAAKQACQKGKEDGCEDCEGGDLGEEQADEGWRLR